MDSGYIEDHKVERILVSTDDPMRTPKAVVAHQMDVTEVPAMIAVETIFISDQLAMQKKIELSQALVLSDAYIEGDTENEADVSLYKTQDFGIMAQPDVEHFAVQTEGPNPQRHREIQTIKLSNHRDIGIQCEWETDTFFEDKLREDIDQSERDNFSNKQQYAQFLEFVQENTYMYKDSKTECMKCGEVCKNFKQTLSHMAMHWGPPTLCERCGQCIEHEKLLSLHQCGFGPPNKNARKHIGLQQCPLYACGIMLKSSMKLLNHLENHMNLAFYNRLTPAKQGKLSFSKRIGMRPKSGNKGAFRGSVKDTLRCQICLIRSTCPSVFAKHRKKCIKRFMQRLKVIKHKNMSSTVDNLLDLENST